MDDNCLIYDFETLSQDTFNGVVVSIASLSFTMSKLNSPDPYAFYKYEDLVESANFMKFNVADQVKNHRRTIQKSTLNWWKGLGPEAVKAIHPSSEDVSIEKLHSHFVDNYDLSKIKRVYTRNNTFDPVLLRSIFAHFGQKDPMAWWVIRDTVSTIEGMSAGTDVKHNFIPDGLKKKFNAHDPRHDIAMDVMRMQTLLDIVVPDDIPF